MPAYGAQRCYSSVLSSFVGLGVGEGLGQLFHWPGTCQVVYAIWPESPRNVSVSAAPCDGIFNMTAEDGTVLLTIVRHTFAN